MTYAIILVSLLVGMALILWGLKKIVDSSWSPARCGLVIALGAFLAVSVPLLVVSDTATVNTHQVTTETQLLCCTPCKGETP